MVGIRVEDEGRVIEEGRGRCDQGTPRHASRPGEVGIRCLPTRRRPDEKGSVGVSPRECREFRNKSSVTGIDGLNFNVDGRWEN